MVLKCIKKYLNIVVFMELYADINVIYYRKLGGNTFYENSLNFLINFLQFSYFLKTFFFLINNMF